MPSVSEERAAFRLIVKTYEAIVNGENVPQAGVPESFKVLVKELQSLGLDVKVLDADNNEIDHKQNIDGEDSFYSVKSRIRKTASGEAEEEPSDELELDMGDDGDDELDLDFGDDSDDESAFESEDEDAFDVDAFFNELNPTINDAGFGNGFVPDEDNM